MAKIALNFEDGVTKIIEGKAGESVADTAYDARINIPLDCKDGICGICKCKIKSGSCDLGFYIDDALTEKEAEEGFALACQMVPKTDMVIEILASSKACKVKIESHATTITDIQFLSSEVVKLTVTEEKGHKFHFLPGQYANIEIPTSKVVRAYSFSGVSHNAHTVEFLVRLLPNGAMSNYLRNEAKTGGVLNLMEPFGSFYLRDITHPTLFFAGGTGIAPFLAMLEKLSKEKKHPASPIHLYYGATTDENLVELERLYDYATQLQLKIFTCVSIEKSAKHAQGFVTQWINKAHLGKVGYDIYICGPPPMVEAVKKAVAEEQIVHNHFYEEKFVQSGN